MKRMYTKPVFVAETYMFNDSIAKCDIDIDTTEPRTFTLGETNACSGGLDGHVYGGQNKSKGLIYEWKMKRGEDPTYITLFNDGTSPGCEFDWDGRTNIVAQTNAPFADSFYGNKATEANHAPGYQGQAFLS